MLLLVHKAHETLTKYRFPHVGRLASPRHYHRIGDTVRAGYVWAADNDAFNGFDPDAYRKMLKTLNGIPGCLFVTIPDVVGDHEATWLNYLEWMGEVEQPRAYVLQDGAEHVPWNGIAALFVGGSTEYKLSREAEEWVREAKDRGKWVHMGRVNSWRRLKLAKAWGVDSIDGTQLSMFTDTYLEQWVDYAKAPVQAVLEGSDE